MHQTDSECRQFPACGYGLAGLCCSSCLLGPCRISPFDRDSQQGRCGDNADLMVAKHILRLVKSEAWETVDRLQEAPGGMDASTEVPAQRAAAEGILSSLFGGSEKETLLSELFPKHLFAHLYKNMLTDEGWGHLLCRPATTTGDVARDVRSILFTAFELSLLDAALHAVVGTVTGGLRRHDDDRDIEKAVTEIEAASSSPVAVCSGEGAGSDMARLCSGAIPRDALMVVLPDSYSLPLLMRELSSRRVSVPPGGQLMGILSSARLAPVLAALASGLSLMSFPGLPIHGSTMVETFLCKDLRNISDSVYLQPLHGQVPIVPNQCKGNRP